MVKPLGEEIFAADNIQDNGFYRNGVLEEGLCASLTCHWVKKTLELGVLKKVTDIGDIRNLSIAQAAFEFGQLSRGATAADDEASLADACGLKIKKRKVTAAPIDQKARREIAVLGLEANVQKSAPTFYWVGLKRTGGGHAIGVQMWCLAHVYLFDANFGLYRYKFPDWVAGFEHLLTKSYRGRYDQPYIIREIGLDT